MIDNVVSCNGYADKINTLSEQTNRNTSNVISRNIKEPLSSYITNEYKCYTDVSFRGTTSPFPKMHL